MISRSPLVLLLVLPMLIPIGSALSAQESDAGAEKSDTAEEAGAVEETVLGILGGAAVDKKADDEKKAAPAEKKAAPAEKKAIVPAEKIVPAARVRVPEGTTKEPEKPSTLEPLPAIAPGASRPLFHFRDASKVAGLPGIAAIDVMTDYGTLSVPVAELVRIRFARRIPGGLREKIDELIGNLGSDDFDTREEATEELEKIGAAALPALRKAVKSSNEEVKSRAQELLGTVYDKVEKETDRGTEMAGELPTLQGTDDEIVTTRMTIKGRVVEDTFIIRSKYGTLTVDTSKLAGVVFRTVGPSSRKVQVAATFQPPGNWLDTKLAVEKGQRVKISASGQTSVSNYGVTSGPDGSRQYSTSRSFNNFPVLSLVGKIGKKGKPFLVGSEFKGKASGSGNIYLGITPFYYNAGGTSGTYAAKIAVGGN